MLATVKRLVEWVMGTRPVRVFLLYSQKNGTILAGGLSLTALYSIFAGIYVGFAIFGLFIQADSQLRETVVSALSTSVPGLIQSGGGSGIINIDSLVKSRVFGWSGTLALIILLSTAINWFGSARSAVRAVFGLPQSATFFLLLKLRDLALVIAFGLVALGSAVLSIVSTSALHFLFTLVGLGDKTVFFAVVARVVGLALVLAIDTAVLAGLYRILSGVHIPLARLLPGSLIGGVALGILKVLGSTIVGGAGKNPLLASFAIILGLLVWFGLVCQVILLSATWIAVDMDDHGVPVAAVLTPAVPATAVPATAVPATPAANVGGGG
jgi:membrane protein